MRRRASAEGILFSAGGNSHNATIASNTFTNRTTGIKIATGNSDVKIENDTVRDSSVDGLEVASTVGGGASAGADPCPRREPGGASFRRPAERAGGARRVALERLDRGFRAVASSETATAPHVNHRRTPPAKPPASRANTAPATAAADWARTAASACLSPIPAEFDRP